MSEVTDLSTAPNVVMYSTAFCGFCQRARGLLERKGVEFQEIKVDEDAGEREKMLKRSGGRRAVPQIFIPKLIDLYQAGEFPFDRLVKFYDFSAINQAIADAKAGHTIKPVLRIGEA